MRQQALDARYPSATFRYLDVDEDDDLISIAGREQRAGGIVASERRLFRAVNSKYR